MWYYHCFDFCPFSVEVVVLVIDFRFAYVVRFVSFSIQFASALLTVPIQRSIDPFSGFKREKQSCIFQIINYIMYSSCGLWFVDFKYFKVYIASRYSCNTQKSSPSEVRNLGYVCYVRIAIYSLEPWKSDLQLKKWV